MLLMAVINCIITVLIKNRFNVFYLVLALVQTKN
jgi:hypothetical protein